MRKFVSLALLGLAIASLQGCGFEYSEGDRVGIVTKISKRGIIWKTIEGQMNLGGFRQGYEGMEANTWDFSVLAEDAVQVLPTLLQAQDQGFRVKIRYHQVLFPFPWDQKSEYRVDKVEILQ